MPEPKSYTAYYKPVPLNFWFYFGVIIFLLLIGYNVFRMVVPFDSDDFLDQWFVPSAHVILFYSLLERSYKKYKNSKVHNCFIQVDSEGIKWRIYEASYHVRESEIIVWSDVRKIVVDDKKITIKYMSTYFSDNIPFEKLAEEDKNLLIEALNDQIQYRSIPYVKQMVA
ncbi:MAG: hypothetical protein IBJ16_11315 [Chitinophagaceae bacterium]|nr:hypothetical protein [Chitinophagaceae bacterium]